MITKFQISDPIWWGYNIDVDISFFNNINDIINYVINNLEVTLKSLNLLPQYEMLQEVRNKFHIHNFSYEELLNNKKNETIYICRHNNTEKDSIKLCC